DAAAPKPADDPDDADNDAAADDDAAWAVSRSVEGRVYTQDVRVQGHAMTIDADGEDGGDARGPNPTRVLHAALAACGSITAQMYARRKEIDLKSVEVAIRAAPGDDPHVNKTLKKRIRLEGDLTDAQRQRIGEIIDKCPVHRMLTEGVVVEREDDD
ncbi:MAG: OsmC family protein, partial [Planctomycetota bacterium]